MGEKSVSLGLIRIINWNQVQTERVALGHGHVSPNKIVILIVEKKVNQITTFESTSTMFL